jgi:hypothetical protein
VDECHHIPAKSFRDAIVNFNSFYLYGLTATPKRKNNDEKLIYVYIGNILYNANQIDQIRQKQKNMEYAGLVIYHKKLDSGRFKLPGFDENTTSLTIHWNDLMMMVQNVKIRPRKLKQK